MRRMDDFRALTVPGKVEVITLAFVALAAAMFMLGLLVAGLRLGLACLRGDRAGAKDACRDVTPRFPWDSPQARRPPVHEHVPPSERIVIPYPPRPPPHHDLNLDDDHHRHRRHHHPHTHGHRDRHQQTRDSHLQHHELGYYAPAGDHLYDFSQPPPTAPPAVAVQSAEVNDNEVGLMYGGDYGSRMLSNTRLVHAYAIHVPSDDPNETGSPLHRHRST